MTSGGSLCTANLFSRNSSRNPSPDDSFHHSPRVARNVPSQCQPCHHISPAQQHALWQLTLFLSLLFFHHVSSVTPQSTRKSHIPFNITPLAVSEGDQKAKKRETIRNATISTQGCVCDRQEDAHPQTMGTWSWGRRTKHTWERCHE